MGRFGVGQPVPRSEDPRFLTGRGRYVADISRPDQAHAVVRRSPYAHADLAAIDIAAAAAMPGVLAVLTGADVAADGLGDIPCEGAVRHRDGRPAPSPGRPLLARGRVRFVGEPVAFVVAETREAALDAAEAVAVDYRPLPAVATIEDAIADGAPQLWDGAPGNLAFHWSLGDAAAVDAAIRAAPRVVGVDLVNNRVAAAPMEPRAVLGEFDAAGGRYTLHTPSQGAHLIKGLLAGATLRVPEDRIRVVTPDVGGAFGAKIFHYPEEALALWAARRLGRPVKWVAERTEAFTGDVHGRDQRNRAEAAIDADGRVLALRVHTYAGMGAYLNLYGPIIPADVMGRMLSGAYAIPLIHAVSEGVYTNTVPVDAYRGAGRPEAAYILERLMDAVARETGLGPDEVRRRNFVRADQMPYRTATGRVYDSGDFEGAMEAAMAAADWAGFEARRAEARARGRLRGIGMSSYVEACGAVGSEEATLAFGADGTVGLAIGTQSAGHGHETAFAQILADRLGVAIEAVRVVQGDTDAVPTGGGTGGSRSLPTGGIAVERAADAVIARGRRFAAHLLQADEAEIEFDGGRFTVAGSERGVALAELARAAAEPENRPPGEAAPGLDAAARFRLDAATYPNGCHVCELEIDPETGAVEIVAYRLVDDFGIVVNPLLLAGQVHGGVVQGIGQALMEDAAYDRDSAQLLAATFLDYAMPRAARMPSIDVAYANVPCTTNPMGIKGAGEAGAIAAPPAVMNAIQDALAPIGVGPVDMPATAERLWRAIRAAQSETAP